MLYLLSKLSFFGRLNAPDLDVMKTIRGQDWQGGRGAKVLRKPEERSNVIGAVTWRRHLTFSTPSLH